MERGQAFFAAPRDIKSLVETHLFGIVPNNSDSTFLMQALATCQQTWNLPLEGQFAFGFTGTNTQDHDRLLWSLPRWRDRFADPATYDWPRNRTACSLPCGDPRRSECRWAVSVRPSRRCASSWGH